MNGASRASAHLTGRRIVFLDVDGTIIRAPAQPSRRTVAAVREARRKGHLVYLCTGRSRTEIPAEVMMIGFDGVISAGGGFTEHEGALIRAVTMPDPNLGEIRRVLNESSIEYILQAVDGAYPSFGLRSRIAQTFERRHIVAGSEEAGRALERASYRGEPAPGSVAKVSFCGVADNAYGRVRSALGEGYHVITGTIPYLGTAGGEVSMRGQTKGAAVGHLVAHLGADLDCAVAIGDNVNDVEMLIAAGVGIAMGDASEQVKRAADEVTEDVDHEGLWHAFRRHGLIATGEGQW